MMILGKIIFFIYVATLTYVAIFCLMQVHLLFYYKRAKRNKPVKSKATFDELPMVTIQLPLYNEMYVVERLVDTIMEFDYPKDRLEVQILDDSNDETVQIVDRKVAEYQAKGFDITAFRRKERSGYKAGALDAGLKAIKGEFVAIFDADFLPRASFLRETIHKFKNPKVGVVQTRWEHINEDYSLITRLQALQLNVHFTVEQVGRQEGNLFLQFNGTAGIWRKKTIEESGGWQPDTLTEDLDLSYRAQLKGWKIDYLEYMGSPAELPAEMNGLKSQQFRWMKGGAETAKKLLPKVWRAPHLSLLQKVHSTLHLFASSIFVFVFIAGVLSVPVMVMSESFLFELEYLRYLFFGMASIILVYYVANVQSEIHEGSFLKKIIKFIILFPLFLSLSMGLSLHNSIAVIQGYLGKKSAFIRTPKFNIKGVSDSFKKQSYLASKLPMTTIFEGFLSIYFALSMAYAIYFGTYYLLLYHFLLAFGFGSICFYSVKHLNNR